MKWTTIQTNVLIIASLLVVMQVYILYVVNGDLNALLAGEKLTTLGLIFAPTIGIIHTLKQFSNTKER